MSLGSTVLGYGMKVQVKAWGLPGDVGQYLDIEGKY
jgi:hypothetical protein